jgi:2-polyprenyl-3-methyl-5-hydroxy-6-metoxy-1,4-benzoquinol methylase
MTKCRLCGESQLKPLFTVRDSPIAHCPNCDFVQVVREPEPDQLKAIYDEAYFGHNKYRDLNTLSIENTRRLRLMQRYIPAGSCVLEAGCGAGYFLEMASSSYTMYGFDLATSAVKQARTRTSLDTRRIQQGTLEAPPQFDNRMFDGICLWDTIEHIWDPLQVMPLLFDRLKPGGYLALSTPNIGTLTARIMGTRWAFMTPPEHLSFLSKQSMHYLMQTALGHQIVFHASWGKKVNAGFLFYKLHRVMPRLTPRMLLKLFEHPPFANLALYVPTGDIQYVVVQKAED